MIIDQHPDNPPDARGCRAIGYWFNDHHPDLPKPENYVDSNWRQVERDAMVRYLKAGHVKASWRGWSNCRICNCMNGSQCLGDGTFVWPEGFAHYVEAHGVRPPDEFSKHVFDKVLSEGFPGPDFEEKKRQVEAIKQTDRAMQDFEQPRWIKPLGRLKIDRRG